MGDNWYQMMTKIRTNVWFNTGLSVNYPKCPVHVVLDTHQTALESTRNFMWHVILDDKDD